MKLTYSMKYYLYLLMEAIRPSRVEWHKNYQKNFMHENISVFLARITSKLRIYYYI